MALDNYEAILKLFAGTTDAITDRQAVVDGGPDKTKWIKDGDWISRHVTLAEGTWVFTADKWKIFTIRFDDTVKTGGETTTGGYYNNISVTSPVKETTTNYSFDYVLGYRVNHDWFNNKSAEWLKFSSTPTDYLEKIGAWGDTDTTSSKSLEAASVAIAGMTTLMETWSGEFTKWAGELNAKGSQLQGTAAGVLKQQLTYFAEQMKIVQNELVDSKAQANLLSNARTLATTAKQLAADIDTWRSPTPPGRLWTRSSRPTSWTSSRLLRPWATRSSRSSRPAGTRKSCSTTPAPGTGTRTCRSSGPSCWPTRTPTG